MFTYCLALLQQVKADKKGVTALEYGVIAAATIVAISLVLPALSTALSGVFTTVTTAL